MQTKFNSTLLEKLKANILTVMSKAFTCMLEVHGLDKLT